MEVYLDNSSTTKLDQRILDKMIDFEKEFYGNPSSVHQEGQKVRIAIENARENISKILGCKSTEIIFTSSGTESNNLAIKGILNENDHCIYSATEHHSVIETYKSLKNIEVSELKVDKNGIVDLKQLRSLIKSNTKLVSIMHANNETGTIQPLQEIKKILGNVMLHSDSVQTIGKIEENPLQFADIVTFCAHKIHGPKGIGVLYIRKNININKIIFGGEQEWNKRAGTENIRGIIGLNEALKIAKDEPSMEYIESLRTHFENKINEIEGVVINSKDVVRVPGITNISFHKLKSQVLLYNLDMNQIYASAGSACASGSIDPSHVLKSMNIPKSRQANSIRFSFSKYNTFDELFYTIETIKKTIERLRRK